MSTDIVTVINGLSRAYRLGAVTSIVLVCAVLLFVTSNRTVGLGATPIRSAWFFSLAVAGLSAVPLRSAFGELGTTFVRAVPLRGLRCAWHAVISFSFVLLLTECVDDVALWRWFLALQILALLVAEWQPDWALLTVLTFGAGSILADHLVMGFPLSGPIGKLHPALWVVAYVFALAAFFLSCLIFVQRD